MSSLLSKIFGSGKRQIASLYLNDDSVQAAQISGDLKTPILLSLNKTEFSKEMVENGEVKMQSETLNILKNLFSGAKPNPFGPGKIYVAIPFSQLYPFIHVFSKNIDKTRIQSDMDEAISSEIPFANEEVNIIRETKIEGDKIISGAVAVPKNWESGIKYLLTESGYSDFQFIPEPYAQISLGGISDSANSVLFSSVGSKIYVSVFYNGLLYDSYSYKDEKNADSIFTEYKNIKENFNNSFGKNIENVCFAGFQDEFINQIKKSFPEDAANIVLIRPENKFLSDLLDNGYSASLAGLVLKSLEG